MKRLLLFALVCVMWAAGARAQIAVSGNLQTLGVQNASGANTFARFRLSNYGGALPIVTSTSAMVSDIQDFHTNGSGAISGSLWGNDSITPVGTTYQVCIFTNGIQFRCANYLITAALYPSGFNLNTAQAILPTPASPTLVTGAQSFTFNQSTPATTWTITHNFGDPNPQVQCFDASGNIIYPDKLTFTSVNVVTALFVSAQSGGCRVISAAYLNIVTSAPPNVVVTNPNGAQMLQGPNPFSTTGPLNANGNGAAGNVGVKYASASAYRYVDGAGSDSNDGLSPGTAFATPQKCNTVVVGLGGGTCDARSLYTLSYSTEIDVGSSGNIPVTLLFPPFGTWTCNVTGGNSCLKLFNFAAAIGASGGQGNQFTIVASNTANVTDVCGNDTASGFGIYLHAEGFHCVSSTSTTISGAVAHFQHLLDVSRVVNVVGDSFTPNTKAFYAHAICCEAHFDGIKGISNNVTGGVPCTFGGTGTDSNQGADFGPISCTSAGSGKNAIALIQGSGQAGSTYHGIYTEMDFAGDTSTPVIGVTGSSGNSDTLEGFRIGVDAAAGASTRYMVNVAANSSVIIRNLQTGGSGNAIVDGNRGVNIQPGANAILTDYSTENPCCGLSGYFTSGNFYGPARLLGSTSDPSGTAGMLNYRTDLSRHKFFDSAWHTTVGTDTTDTLTNKTLTSPIVNLLTNGTGLQLFNTTTTCTTGASVGATCTTGVITLPVAEADTSYRIVCTGKGPTAVPVVAWTTNSSATQFTITIAALTAVAASFTSFDCTAGHN